MTEPKVDVELWRAINVFMFEFRAEPAAAGIKLSEPNWLIQRESSASLYSHCGTLA